MKRIDKAEKIGNILDDLYPETPIPLNHTSAYTLLVAVMLSAQATDQSVNKATSKLFKTISSPEQMIELGENKLKSFKKKKFDSFFGEINTKCKL